MTSATIIFKDDHYGSRKQIQAAIRANGIGYSGVIPGDEGNPVGWIYTIGLTLVRHPELVVPDYPGRMAVDAIHETALAIAARTLRLTPGPLPLEGGTWTVSASMAKASRYGVPLALAMYGERHTVRAYTLMPPEQMAWPPGTPWHGYRCSCPQCDRLGAGLGIAGPTSRVGSVTVITETPGYSGLLLTPPSK